jgi:hypothetical protein
MAARQEVRLKEAEAADYNTANRVTFAEPTRRIIRCTAGKVQSE